MKSHESTLAFFHGRRVCRLSSSVLQPTGYSRRISIFISFLFVVSLLSSVAAVQQQVVSQQQQRQQRIPLSLSETAGSSIILTNGTTTTTISSISFVRRRIPPSSTPLSTTTIVELFQNQTSSSSTTPTTTTTSNLVIKKDEIKLRRPPHLVGILIVCSLMTSLTIAGNLVVIISVCLVRKLQTASNILIVSLAVSDIFVGIFIMPLAMVLEMFDGYWILGSIMCDIWTSTDVLLCTSSILNFLVISIDRYCIINHPFKYAPMRKVKLLSLMIAGVWILSALVSLPPIFGWGRPSQKLPRCQVNDALSYQIFATMLSFYIPLIAVLIIYANIYRTAQTAMDNRSSVQMSQFLTHNNSSAAVTANIHNNNNMNLTTPLAQQSNGNSCSSPQLLLAVSNANNTNDDEILSSSSSGEHQHRQGRKSLRRTGTSSSSHGQKGASFLSPARCLGRRLSTPFSGRLSIFVSRRYSFFRHVHLPNQKAIRTLGVILGTFIVCWLPFMLLAIIKPLCRDATNSLRTLDVPAWVDSTLLWFGYSSSMLNPLIYSKFNTEFRTPFREIICCRCRGLNEKMRRQEYLQNMYGGNQLQPVPPPPSKQHHGSTHAPGGFLEAAV